MPEMHFVVRWPDGDQSRCYSPSLVVRDYLEVGRTYVGRRLHRTQPHHAQHRLGARAREVRLRLLGGARSAARARDARVRLRARSAGDGDGVRAARRALMLGTHRQCGGDRRRPGRAVDELLPQATRHRPRRAREAPPRSRVARAPLGLVLPGDAQLAMQAARVPVQRAPIRTASWCKDAIVRYLEDYARSFEPPLHRGRDARPACAPRRAAASRSRPPPAIATPTTSWWRPAAITRRRIPRLAERLPDELTQLHASEYRNPAALPPGDVLVVGSGQSGCRDRRGPAPRGPRGAPVPGQRAAHGEALPRPRRRRLAGRHGLLRHARRQSSAQGAGARQRQPLRHRPRRRARHRSAPARAGGHAAVRAAAGGTRRPARIRARPAPAPGSGGRRRREHQVDD